MSGTPATAATRVTTDEVARYYDRNTRRFLLASARGTHAMHRELWGEGVRSSAEALAYVDGLVADALAPALDGRGDRAAPPVILDLGCGVGGTALHLVERFPGARLVGVTLSERQVEIAERLVRERGWDDRCTFRRADFHALELDATADAIVAVESFAHAASPDAFLASAARNLRRAGRLVIADDFLARDEGALAPDERRHVARFRAGWRVPAVCTVEELRRAAQARGLRVDSVLDLSGLTRPGRRLRDRLIALASPLFAALGLARVPFYGNMIGGNALQIGMRRGFLRYQLVTLSRQA